MYDFELNLKNNFLFVKFITKNDFGDGMQAKLVRQRFSTHISLIIDFVTLNNVHNSIEFKNKKGS